MKKLAIDVLNRFLYRTNLPNKTGVSGTLSDPDTLQLREFLYAVCEELRVEGPFRQQLQTYNFSTAIGVATYPLPGDYWEHHASTFYNQDTDRQLVGPLPDSQFMAYKEGTAVNPYEFIWRIKGFDENGNSTEGRQIELWPVPEAVEALTQEYVSANLFVPPDWAPSTTYTSGDYVNVNGRIYLCDTNGTSGSTAPSGTDANQTDGTTQWDYFNAPYETLESDDDFLLFDADLVLLGIRAKYFEEHQGELAPSAMREFNRKKVKSRFRWHGRTRVKGDRMERSSLHRPYIKSQSWSYSN